MVLYHFKKKKNKKKKKEKREEKRKNYKSENLWKFFKYSSGSFPNNSFKHSMQSYGSYTF